MNLRIGRWFWPPYALLLLGLLVAVSFSVRIGVLLVGSAGLCAGVARWFLAPEQVPILVSRKRVVDVTFSLVLGAALAAMAFLLPH